MIFSCNSNEEKKLLSLLNQHEKNIDYLLYLRQIIWEKDVSFDINKAHNEFEKRTLLFDALNKNYPYPNDFVKHNILWDTKLLNIDYFLTNPYISAINNLSFKEDDWCLNSKTIKAYTLFPYQEEYHYAPNYLLKMSLAFFDKAYNYPSLSLFDREWMSLNPYEIRTMEVPISLAKGKVLTLGLGLGYFAYMAHLKEEVKEVHIVEMDLQLIKIFNKYLLPLFPYPHKIHIHKADAFYFIKDIKDKDYDFIFSDLWHDVSDGLSMYIKLKRHFVNFKNTQCTYWIEGAIITYFRLLVIGVLKNEYYHLENDENELFSLIKNKLINYEIKDSNDLDSLLSIKGLHSIIC